MSEAETTSTRRTGELQLLWLYYTFCVSSQAKKLMCSGISFLKLCVEPKQHNESSHLKKSYITLYSALTLCNYASSPNNVETIPIMHCFNWRDIESFLQKTSIISLPKAKFKNILAVGPIQIFQNTYQERSCNGLAHDHLQILIHLDT